MLTVQCLELQQRPKMDRALILKHIKDNLESFEYGKIFIFRIRPIPNGLDDSGDLVGLLYQKCEKCIRYMTMEIVIKPTDQQDTKKLSFFAV